MSYSPASSLSSFLSSSGQFDTTLLTVTTPLSKPLLYQHNVSGLVEPIPPNSFNFGPWMIFNFIWRQIFGYSAEQFRFNRGSTPLSTTTEALSWIILYYIVIFGGRELMRCRTPFKLQKAFIIHNWYLTVISGGLLVLFAQQLIPQLWKFGLYENVCGRSGWTDKLVVLYYLNYLTKYLELLDTVFLVLKKKPLTFLHTYHHGATALLCYTQLVGETSVSWVPITLNLTVHVVMYWYYYQSARGVRVAWKQYITMLQITQFVLDLGFIYFACWNYYASTYAPALPHYGTCGDPKQEVAAFTGCAIISSYLVLFILFYLSTYKQPSTQQMIREASKTEVPSLQTTARRIRSASLSLAEKINEQQCSFTSLQ